jgi:hypothetical protein
MLALFQAGISIHLIARYSLQTLQMFLACSPQKKCPWVTRILCSIGGFLPSISVAAVIPCRTRVPPTVHHRLRWYPACSKKSINRTHQSPQTHPQRTLLYIELEVNLCRFLLCGMVHPLVNSIKRLQCWRLPDNTPDIQYLPQRCLYNAA